MENFQGAIGILVLPLIAYALSLDRSRIRWRPVIGGFGLQLVFALIVLNTAAGERVFEYLGVIVTRVLGFTTVGSQFIFGWLIDESIRENKFIFAVQVLPTIIFFSSLMAVLYHLGIMQWVVQLLARFMKATMGVSGAESLSVAANIFVGQTEAPLVVRPYIAGMTRSELMALMTGGFATIAGSVLAMYIGWVGEEYARHFLAASVMSAPAAFVMAKIMLPETEESLTAGSIQMRLEKKSVNVIDAAATGAGDGLKLALNVGAMLLAFVALIAMIDYPLERISVALALDQYLGGRPLSLEVIFGFVFWPLAWVIGVSPADCTAIGALMGTKIAATELIAYLSLHDMIEVGSISEKSVIIATYALCGFANFGSIAIQLGGIGGIAPERKHDLARLGLRAMTGGALASFMTAAFAGMMVRTGG